MNKIEISLIRAIVQEDRVAMAQLYDIYYPRLYRFLTGMIQDRELIMELINDVMMIIWQKAASFRRRSLVSTWIFGIAYHRALDRIRKNQRYRQVLEEAPGPTPMDSSLNESITARDLKIIMQVLTPEQQAVAKLTFEFGYSYPEIAEILQIPVNTVKTRMFHARKSMQKSVNQGVTSK
ncbi:MAG: RNA polymerase sigma factor [Gammaproteobacteria bacterium]|nr:RNA polymerase sigma factor [Gammaproteobacteria bacterium]